MQLVLTQVLKRSNGNETEFNPLSDGAGGNLTVEAELIFSEGLSVGIVGDGPGFRGFAGVTLDKVIEKISEPSCKYFVRG